MSRTKKLLVAAAAAGIVAALAPLAASPASANCASPVVIFFHYGARVAGQDGAVPPRSANAAAVGCTAGDASGLTIDAFYVPPGAGFAKARHTTAGATSGSVIGLGANYTGPWPLTEVVTGTFGESPYVPMDPTQLMGTINASASGGSTTYRTLDR